MVGWGPKPQLIQQTFHYYYILHMPGFISRTPLEWDWVGLCDVQSTRNKHLASLSRKGMTSVLMPEWGGSEMLAAKAN